MGNREGEVLDHNRAYLQCKGLGGNHDGMDHQTGHVVVGSHQQDHGLWEVIYNHVDHHRSSFVEEGFGLGNLHGGRGCSHGGHDDRNHRDRGCGEEQESENGSGHEGYRVESERC